MTSRIVVLCLACLAGLTACNKSQPQSPPANYFGVEVDLPKLDNVFTNSPLEVQNSVVGVKRFYRYSQFLQAMMELDKLSNDPTLTEAQKKLIAVLLEQTKQVIAKAPPPPGQ